MKKYVGILCALLLIIGYKHYKKDSYTFLEEKNLQGINTIVFDLTGVVFKVNTMKVIKNLGIGNSLSYLLRHRSSPVSDTLKLAEKMTHEMPDQYQHEATYKGYYLPKVIFDWTKGITSAHELGTTFATFIEQKDQARYFATQEDKQLIETIISVLIDPVSFTAALKPNRALMSAINKIASSGNYKLYILSNLDPDSFRLLRQQYPDFFEQFDGIIVSGHVGINKPSEEIFTLLIDRYQIHPDATLFIDDQQENINAADSLGFRTHLYA